MGHISQQQVNRERDHNAAQRAAVAYRLWLRGLTFEAIAHQIGVKDRSAARKAWLRGKQQQVAPPDLEAERQRERERLEIAYASLAERIEDGDVSAIDRGLAIAARKASLLGLDLGKQDIGADPGITIIEQWPAAFAALRQYADSRALTPPAESPAESESAE